MIGHRAKLKKGNTVLEEELCSCPDLNHVSFSNRLNKEHYIHFLICRIITIPTYDIATDLENLYASELSRRS